MHVSSKKPIISKETVRCSTDGNYEQYCISANSGLVEELSIEDITFIRDRLSEFIEENARTGGGDGEKQEKRTRKYATSQEGGEE